MIKNKKGSGSAVVAGMMIFIVGVVALFISFFITAEMGSTVNTSINNANNTDLQGIYNSSSTMIYSGLKIMGIVLIIVGAGVVISAVKSF